MAPHPGIASRTIIECQDCSTFQYVPALQRGVQASCLQCDGALRRTSSYSDDAVLALVLTAAILYLVGMTAPFLAVDVVGQTRDTTVLTLPYSFVTHDASVLGLIVLATAVIAPAVKIGVMLTVLLGLRVANPPRLLPWLFRYYRRIGPWAMPEVFLLGVFVAFTRLGAIATVHIGVGLYAIVGLVLAQVAADTLLDQEEVWLRMEARHLLPVHDATPARGGTLIGCLECGRTNQAVEGDPCRRCGNRLWERKGNSLVNTWLLLLAGAILYIPANLYPVLSITKLGAAAPSTILGGAEDLLEAGMWPLALLVFVASLLIPVLKLVSLAVMLITTHRRSDWRLRDRTRLYRIVEFIGRWSMIDVFMLSTLVGLVHAGVIVDIEPGLGAICFGSVVVLTMLATLSFDPRLMWDAAAAGATDSNAVPAGPAQPRAT